MDKNWLEIKDYLGKGYQPLVDFGTWRVAILRWEADSMPGRIQSMERHTQTDEVFVLLAGQAALLLGGISDVVDGVYAAELEPLKLYNVKQNVWHTVLLNKDASILIVEDRDTGSDNTEHCSLSAELKNVVKSLGRAYQSVE
jgi:ureidoglycolate hydrolase